MEPSSMNKLLAYPNDSTWEKLGRLLVPDPRYSWMSTVTGSSFGMPVEDGPLCDVYVTGRDDQNRSRIGFVRIDLDAAGKIVEIRTEELMLLGDLRSEERRVGEEGRDDDGTCR